MKRGRGKTSPSRCLDILLTRRQLLGNAAFCPVSLIVLFLVVLVGCPERGEHSVSGFVRLAYLVVLAGDSDVK